jgi:peptidyl-prolyl cis-trans isomerase SurA
MEILPITEKRNLYLIIIPILLLSFLPISSVANQDELLMEIHGRKITKTEFLRLWKKNYLYTETQPLDEYIDLFIDFHLKVAHAREKGLHEETDFRNELSGYRRQLSLPYLSDPETEDMFAREAYERLLYNVNASHILVRLGTSRSPEDTLAAWEKAMMIRERIVAGESFEAVARATSDDPSAKNNSGNLGYFTAMHTPYPFETAVYNAEPGDISMPFRTRSGYHIIRLNDKQRSTGEVRAAHLMLGFNKYDNQEAETRINEIYRDIIDGYDFELMTKQYSTDINSAGAGGELPWFGPGRIVPEFEKAAFALVNPGDISEPVRTNYGWHIIKLLERREIPPYDDIKKELIGKIREAPGSRQRVITNALVERLKREWEFVGNPQAIEVFAEIADYGIFNGNWVIPSDRRLDMELFRVSDKKVTLRDFAGFITENVSRRNPSPLDEFIISLYDEFASQWLIDHENRNLENKYPEFRFLMQEYEDGMLLFEITEREVWSRTLDDSAGLAAFYEKNMNNYMHEKRVSASIFTAADGRTAQRAANRASRSGWLGRDNDWVIGRFNRGGEESVTVESGMFSRGDNDLTDKIVWKEGCVTDVTASEGVYRFVLIDKVLEPVPKTLEEARGVVLSDYQDYIEAGWIKELRGKYEVIIYNDVLAIIE